MVQVPEVKLIFSLTVVFIVGTFVFTVIFNALALFNELPRMLSNSQVNVASESINEEDVVLLKAIPWLLGVLYFFLVGVIAYFMYKRYKGGGDKGPVAHLIKRY